LAIFAIGLQGEHEDLYRWVFRIGQTLNQIISDYSENKDIVIVEWSGAGEEDERIRFWEDEIKDGIELIRLENILRFKDWK